MKPRSFFSVLFGVVVALLLIGAAGAYWLATGSSAQLPKQTATSPSTTMFVSRQSPAMVSLLVNPDRLESFWLAGTSPANRRKLQADLNQLQQTAFSKVGLDYNRDLKPWLGDEITFALTTPDVDRDATDGLQPGYLLVLTADNAQLAQESIQAFWQRRAAARDLIFEQFAGVQLIHAANRKGTGELQPTLTSAVVGNRYVLLANYPKVLRDALNNVQVPELSLERNLTYQQALEQFSGQKLGIGFVNFAQLEPWLGKQPDRSEQPELPIVSGDGSTTNGSTTRRYDGLLAALKPTPQGLLADTILLPTEPALQLLRRSTVTEVDKVLQFIPGSSSLAIASQNLQQTWEQWQGSWGANFLGEQAQQAVTALQQRWGLQFPDAFDWVTGEYALAQLPSADRSQPDWIFVAQQSPASTEGIAQLDRLAQQQGVSIGSLSLGEQKIYAWTRLIAASPTSQSGGATSGASLRAKVEGVHTTVGNYELFATSLEALEQALAAQQLTPPPDLQDAIAQLQTPNQGYLYFNQAKLEQILQSIRQLEPLKKQLSGSVRSAVISSYGTDETGLRGAIFLHLNGV